MKRTNQFLFIVGLIWSSHSFATISLFTDYTSWVNSMTVPVAVEYFGTSRGEVGLANELGGYVSGTNVNVGKYLTFDKANTGLSNSFRINTQEPGARFTYYDTEGDSDFNHALSVGDIDNYDDDNWIMHVLDGPEVYGFGFYLRDNHSSSGETLRINNDANLQIGISGLAHNTWVYISTDFAITSVRHDERNDSDDIALSGFRFAHAVPAPAGLYLLIIGLMGTTFVRYRNR